MKLGTVFMSLMGGPPSPARPFARWIAQAEKALAAQESAGFSFAAFTHAYQSSLAGGMQPLVLMSRLSAISGQQRLAAQVLLLPLLNAMDVAYNVATLDHIAEGRLDLGIGIGYHPEELLPSGITRADRVPKFEEAVELLGKFWSGEPVYHQGRYFQVSGTQLGLVPVQRPRPPLWGSCHSHGAAARAGRLLDGVVIGPQVRFNDRQALLATFRNEWQKHHAGPPTMVGSWQPMIVGQDPREALDKAVASGRLQFRRYREGDMQEKTMVNLPLELDEKEVADWAILGSYEDCLEGLRRCRDSLGLTHVTCQFYNLPQDPMALLEWLQGFGEEVTRKL